MPDRAQARVLGPPARPLTLINGRRGCSDGERVPQRGGWVGQPQMHVTLSGQRDQDVVLGAVQTGQAEDRQPVGQIDGGRIGGDPSQGLGQSFPRRGNLELAA